MLPVSPGMVRKVLVSIAALAPHSMQTERIMSHHNIVVDDHRSCLASETVNARLTVALNGVDNFLSERLQVITVALYDLQLTTS